MSKRDLSHVRYVFFDLDDTLCAYWDACKIALRETFKGFGPVGHEIEDLVAHWAAAFREFGPNIKGTKWYPQYLLSGEPTRTEQMRLTLERLGIADHEMAQVLGDRYGELRNANLRMFPDGKAVIDALYGQVPMGLITNGPADVQRQEIETLGIGRYFEKVYIEGEMGFGKPLPEVFSRVSDEVGVSSSDILFVGNSYAHDIRPALAAGWHAIWVKRDSDVPPSAHGHTSKPEEMPREASEPDAIVEDLRDILSMLGVEHAKR